MPTVVSPASGEDTACLSVVRLMTEESQTAAVVSQASGEDTACLSGQCGEDTACLSVVRLMTEESQTAAVVSRKKTAKPFIYRRPVSASPPP
ncbi:hypothetical protein ACOMHN_009540 [Nucella lapillus]